MLHNEVVVGWHSAPQFDKDEIQASQGGGGADGVGLLQAQPGNRQPMLELQTKSCQVDQAQEEHSDTNTCQGRVSSKTEIKQARSKQQLQLVIQAR